MRGFLDYSGGNTILHRMNPLVKLLISLIISVSCFLSGYHIFIAAVVILNLVIAAIGGIARRAVAMLGTLLKLSLVLFLIQIFFIRDGGIILKMPFGIFITDIGFSFSLLIVLRLIAATMPLTIMLSLTKPNDLTNSLVEILGIPYKYAFSLTTAIRFIPVLINDMQSVMEAQKARGVEIDTKNIFRKIGMILPLCVPLVVSSVKRTEACSISAELRGFHMRNRNSGYKKYGFGTNDAIAFILSLLLIVTAAVL
jgi:energy-coupling factor transport system permease protein